jgi:hypothetical protein
LANGHGGYRKPANPAPVSGPGAHSKRTDGKQPVMTGLGDGGYGDEAAMEQIQGGAPMAQVASGGFGAPAPVSDPMASIVGLDAPSQQPGVPVTDGADAGAGVGSNALGLTDPNRADAAYLKKYLPVFVKMANSDDSPPGFKQWVRQVVANL